MEAQLLFSDQFDPLATVRRQLAPAARHAKAGSDPILPPASFAGAQGELTSSHELRPRPWARRTCWIGVSAALAVASVVGGWHIGNGLTSQWHKPLLEVRPAPVSAPRPESRASAAPSATSSPLEQAERTAASSAGPVLDLTDPTASIALLSGEIEAEPEPPSAIAAEPEPSPSPAMVQEIAAKNQAANPADSTRPPKPRALKRGPSPPRAKQAPGSAQPPIVFRGVVDVHNRWRRQAGVPPLSWLPANATAAQSWANQLAQENCTPRFNHEPAHRRVYRENILHAYASQPYDGWRRTPEAVVDRWGEAGRNYDRASDRCRVGGEGCTQYRHLISEDARYVGCGRAQCATAEIWVCSYSPSG